MRRRLVLATVAVVVAVLAVLVPPVVILLNRAATRELQVRLESQASAISAAIADDVIAGVRPAVDQIARMVPPGDHLVITDSSGTVLREFGDAPASSVTGTAPGPEGTSVELSSSDAALRRRVRGPLLALGAFAVGSIGLGALLAARIGNRLTRPLRELAAAADRLGAGDFSAPLPPPSGMAEIDGISTALTSSARRLDDLLSAERSFTSDATHQLRTGLAGVSLQLELLADHADADVRRDAGLAVDQVDRLTGTLDDLLVLVRGGAGRQRAEIDLGELVGHHAHDWHARVRHAGRTLVVHQRPSTVRATPGFVGQIVDVLLDNALRHGRGAITVELGERGVRVGDAGAIAPDGAGAMFRDRPEPSSTHGRGLALARRLAEADGGRLELRSSDPVVMELTYPEG
jgi:signal transduction histidine kinase